MWYLLEELSDAFPFGSLSALIRFAGAAFFFPLMISSQ